MSANPFLRGQGLGGADAFGSVGRHRNVQHGRAVFEQIYVNGRSGDRSARFGGDLQVTGAIRTPGATGANSVAFGPNASASGEESIAIGSASSSDGGRDVAIGTNSQADSAAMASAATAVGFASAATARRTTVVGQGADVLANDGVAIGTNARAAASAVGGIAIGNSAIAFNSSDVAIGRSAFAFGGGSPAIAIGDDPNAGGTGAISIGDGVVVDDRTLAIGFGTGSSNGANDCVIVGDGSSVDEGTNCVVVGSQTNLTGAETNRICLGTAVQSSVADSFNVGSDTHRLTSWRLGPDIDVLLPVDTGLTDSANNFLFRIDLASGDMVALAIEVDVAADDGSDFQHRYISQYAVALRNPSGGVVTDESSVADNVALTAGTLAVTLVNDDDGGNDNYRWGVNPVSSLAGASISARVRIRNISPTVDLQIVDL